MYKRLNLKKSIDIFSIIVTSLIYIRFLYVKFIVIINDILIIK